MVENNKQVIERVNSFWIFWCPGCKENHYINDNWTFDGNVEKPTISPSVRVSQDGNTLCHLFISAGKIRYLPDCIHELKNQTVDMVPINEI